MLIPTVWGHLTSSVVSFFFSLSLNYALKHNVSSVFSYETENVLTHILGSRVFELFFNLKLVNPS